MTMSSAWAILGKGDVRPFQNISVVLNQIARCPIIFNESCKIMVNVWSVVNEAFSTT